MHAMNSFSKVPPTLFCTGERGYDTTGNTPESLILLVRYPRSPRFVPLSDLHASLRLVILHSNHPMLRSCKGSLREPCFSHVSGNFLAIIRGLLGPRCGKSTANPLDTSLESPESRRPTDDTNPVYCVPTRQHMLLLPHVPFTNICASYDLSNWG